MAYTYDQVEYLLASAQSFTSTGDKLTWSVGYMRHNIRAVAITITTAPTVQTGIIKFTTRNTPGSNSGITAGDVAVLNLLTTYAIGNVIYKDGLNAVFKPGQELVVNVSQAPTAGAGNVSIFAEPNGETPLNNASMIATT